jgi:acetoin utilization protein AcuC
MFYAFEEDGDLVFADIHEDGQDLYPGTGARAESGRGAAVGTKLNLPLAPGADDAAFLSAWAEVEAHLARFPSDFILFQCGADSLAGDPITHLRFTEAAHAHAARRLCAIADAQGHGRVLGMGGGGYNRRNLARAWTAVVGAFLAESPVSR